MPERFEAERLQEDRSGFARGVLQARCDEIRCEVEAVGDGGHQLVALAGAREPDDLGGAQDGAKRAVDPIGRARAVRGRRTRRIVHQNGQALAAGKLEEAAPVTLRLAAWAAAGIAQADRFGRRRIRDPSRRR